MQTQVSILTRLMAERQSLNRMEIESIIYQCQEELKARRITGLDMETKEAIRNAVRLAMHYWPNAHLGEETRRGDMRSAFRFLRYKSDRFGVHNAITSLECDAYNHADM